jgi:hypothetical protein
MDRFFFFGTLMDRDVLELVLDRTVTEQDLSPARLNGFARRRIAKDSFPVLIKAETESVDGQVFMGTGPVDRDRILFFEDFDYDLEPCEIELPDGTVESAIYCGAAPTAAATEEPWDLGSWAARHKASFLKVSRIYMDCFGKMTPEEAEDIWQNARREHQPLAAD